VSTLAAAAPVASSAHVPERETLRDYADAAGLRTLVIGASRDPNAKVTVLLVSPATGEPQAAIKAPTTDLAAAAVEAERRVLVELERLELGDAGKAVPRVLDTVDYGGRAALVTTAVRGAPMFPRYLGWLHTARRSRVEADFRVVDRWLAEFQRRTAQDAPAPATDVGARLLERFAGEDGLDGVTDWVNDAQEHLRRDAVAASALHGDLWLGNILAAGGRVSGVVDWEAGAPAGDPRRDVVRFANVYALYLDHATFARGRVAGHRGLRSDSFGAGLAFALSGHGWFPELFRSFVERALERVGCPAANWRRAALLGIAEVAASTDEPGFARSHFELCRRLIAGDRA
jgi:aminoglycoside phosphotransferase